MEAGLPHWLAIRETTARSPVIVYKPSAPSRLVVWKISSPHAWTVWEITTSVPLIVWETASPHLLVIWKTSTCSSVIVWKTSTSHSSIPVNTTHLSLLIDMSCKIAASIIVRSAAAPRLISWKSKNTWFEWKEKNALQSMYIGCSHEQNSFKLELFHFRNNLLFDHDLRHR